MKLASVSEAREYGNKQPLPGLTGKVKVVFKPKTGTAADGNEWTNQGIVLADLNDPKVEVTLTLWNHAPYDDSIKGKVVTILPGPKGGLAGAEPYVKTKPDGSEETIYKVQASKMCDVTFGGGQPATQAPKPAQAPQRQAAVPSPTPQAPRPAPAWTWQEFIDTEAVVQEMCLRKAAAIAAAVNTDVGATCGEGLGPAQVASIAMALRIEGQKAGLTCGTKLGTVPPRPPVESDGIPGLDPEVPSEDDGSGDQVPF